MNLPSILPKSVKRRMAEAMRTEQRRRKGLGAVPASPAALAQAVSLWKPARHLTLLDQKLVDLAEGRLRRLIVQAPPRHGKSRLCSIYMPAWYLGRFPDREVIVTAATDSLAAEFSAMTRNLLVEHGRGLFGVSVRRDQKSRQLWALGPGGGLRAAGVGGDIIGRGANLLIIDDYIKNHDQALSENCRTSIHQWYSSTSSTRLTPDGAVLIISTRWHPQDLIGQLLDEQQKGGDVWETVRLPALAEGNDPLGREPGEPLWPERYSREWLLNLRNTLTARGQQWVWDALYQQNPPSQIEAEWPETYFPSEMWFSKWPEEETIQLRVIALDPSMGKDDRADYSAFVCLAVDRGGHLWVEADLQRRDASQTADDAIALARRFRPAVLGVEVNQFQSLLADRINARATQAGIILRIQPFNNLTKKVTRIRSLTGHLADKKFHFKSGSPGTSLLVDQLRGFPNARHDDGPDALEMAVRLVRDLLYEDVQDEVPQRVRAG